MDLKTPTKQQKKESIFSLQMPGKQKCLVLGLLGLMLVVIGLPVQKSGEAVNSGSTVASTKVQDSTDSADAQQLETLLSKVEGVGKVEVMIYLQNTGETFTAWEDSAQGEICGVLIVAEGADNPVTVRKIQEAVMALFQIEAHKIEIMKMK